MDFYIFIPILLSLALLGAPVDDMTVYKAIITNQEYDKKKRNELIRKILRTLTAIAWIGWIIYVIVTP